MSNYDNYNKIIDQYINQDEVKSALLLTAPWGSGKSYYIEHSLYDFLKSKNKDILNISLYGINSTEEINILLINGLMPHIKFVDDIRKLKIGDKIRENSLASITAGKIGSFIGGFCEKINLKYTKNDLKNIVKILNDKKVLVVLEDIERTNINIVDLLGYVNNVIDCTNIKILLVANENIFLKKKDNEIKYFFNKDDEKHNKDVEDEKYLDYKEKTISGTIKFESDREETIKEILNHFDEVYKLSNNKFIDNYDTIFTTMKNSVCYNYRVLIFALQKIIDYFGESIGDRNKRFFNIVTYSILRFAIQIRTNREPDNFEDNTLLGISSLKQYVEGDITVVEHIDYFEKSYIEYIEKWEKNHKAKELLEKLQLWWDCDQHEVEELIEKISKSVKSKEISADYYESFMYFMLPLKQYINTPNVIDECKELCLKNVKDPNIEIDYSDDIQFGYDMFIENNDERYKEYNLFLGEYKMAINNRKNSDSKKNLIYDSIDKFCDKVESDKRIIHSNHKFMCNVDVVLLSKLIVNSHTKGINRFRKLLKNIYDVINIKEVYPNDYLNVFQLKESLLENKGSNKDKIALYILELLDNELAKYLSKLK